MGKRSWNTASDSNNFLMWCKNKEYIVSVSDHFHKLDHPLIFVCQNHDGMSVIAV